MWQGFSSKGVYKGGQCDQSAAAAPWSETAPAAQNCHSWVIMMLDVFWESKSGEGKNFITAPGREMWEHVRETALQPPGSGQKDGMCSRRGAEVPLQPRRSPCWSSLLLMDGSRYMESCWGSAWRDAACGKHTQDQFGKKSILWKGPYVKQGLRVTMKNC